MFPGVGRGEGNLSWLRITKEILIIKVCSRPIVWCLHSMDEPVVCAVRMDALEQGESLFLVFVAWDKLSILPICMKGACSTAMVSSSEPGPERNVLERYLGNRRHWVPGLPSSTPFLLLLQRPFSLPPAFALMSGMNTAKFYALQMSWWFISNFPFYRTDL